MAGLERALKLLEATAADMRQAEAEVRSESPDDPTEMRREIALLKREIAGMMRVVDGCAALCRGLSIRLGCTTLAYTPQGRTVTAPAVSAACELQG
jgi:hypothetical protein